jgi:outer membrane protein assembly factor BamA
LHLANRRLPLALSFALLVVGPALVLAVTLDASRYTPYVDQTVVGRRVINPGVTREFIIVRELQQQVGAPFAIDVLQADLSRLENLGIFSLVHVAVLEVTGGIELEYHVTETPWIVPYFAFRYNDENGWSVGPALTSLNLAGRQVLLSGRVLVGGTTTFEARLLWPWIAYDHLSLDLTANHLVRQDEVLEFEEKSSEFTPWVGTYLGQRGRLAGTAGWFQMNADQDGRTLSPTNRDNLVRIGMRLGWDSRESWRDPRHGWQNEIEVMKVGGWLGGQGRYTQVTVDLRRFVALHERQSFFLGALTTLSSGVVGADYPGYLVYRMGGANTIRGYEIKELGKELFGKNQLITTAEYHFNLLPLRPYKLLRWSISVGVQAAVFADVGVAWSDDSHFAWNRFKSGFGTGLRLLVPGSEALRLDLGFSEDGTFALHFGPWFRWTAQRQRLR